MPMFHSLTTAAMSVAYFSLCLEACRGRQRIKAYLYGALALTLACMFTVSFSDDVTATTTQVAVVTHALEPEDDQALSHFSI